MLPIPDKIPILIEIDNTGFFYRVTIPIYEYLVIYVHDLDFNCLCLKDLGNLEDAIVTYTDARALINE